MRDQLIVLLRRHPFAPFSVTLKTHEVYRIDGVEQLAVAKERWAVVDADGQIRIHSFQAIKGIAGIE